MLKLDPTNTELLQQKQRLLKEAIVETKTKLEALNDAEKKVKVQFEEGTLGREKYEAVQREIIETENKLKSLQEEVKNVENANSSWTKVANKVQEFGNKASAAAEKVKPLSTAMTAVATAAVATVPATEEYRKIMASLETSSAHAGYTTEETAETFRTLYGVLADDQTAATTTANLQALGIEQSKLTDITNGAIGAWATYGDSIPIDGLAESINETIKTAKVTGTFADVLNWAGTSEDGFNEKLENCASASDRTNLVLQELASQGLIDAGKGWQENNKSLVDANNATLSFKDATAELAETIAPVVTKVTEFAANLISMFNSLSPEAQAVIMTIIGIIAVASPLLSIIGKIITIAGVFSTMAAGTVLAVTAVIAIIAAVVVGLVTLYNKCEWFRDGVNAIINAITGFFQNLGNKIKETFNKAQEDIHMAVIGIIAFFINLKQKAEEIWDNIVKTVVGFAVKIAMKAKNTFDEMVEGIKNTCSKIAGIVSDGFSGAINFITGLPKQALKWGADFIDGMVKGIKNAAHKVTEAAKGIADGIAGFLHFSRPDEGPLHEYETWMPDFVDGLVRTLKKNEFKITDEVKNMAGKMANSTIDMNTLVTAGAMPINLESNTMVQIGNESLDSYITKAAVKGINRNRLNSKAMKGRR